MQFAAHGVHGLISQFGDLFVTQFLVGHKQQQDAVFIGQAVERLLDAVAEFLDFQNAQWRIRRGGENMTAVSALAQVAAMIDGNTVKPRATG